MVTILSKSFSTILLWSKDLKFSRAPSVKISSTLAKLRTFEKWSLQQSGCKQPLPEAKSDSAFRLIFRSCCSLSWICLNMSTLLRLFAHLRKTVNLSELKITIWINNTVFCLTNCCLICVPKQHRTEIYRNELMFTYFKRLEKTAYLLIPI